MGLIDIVNVVVKARVKGISSSKIIESFEDAEYRPNGFPATGVRLHGVRIWFFDSGKVSSNGANSEEHAYNALYEFVRIMSRNHAGVRLTERPEMVQVVAKVFTERRLDCAKMEKSVQFQQKIERFSSAIYDYGGGVHLRAYPNNVMIASAPTLQKIVDLSQKLAQCDVIMPGGASLAAAAEN